MPSPKRGCLGVGGEHGPPTGPLDHFEHQLRLTLGIAAIGLAAIGLNEQIHIPLAGGASCGGRSGRLAETGTARA
ncbi:hypothetical protein [Pseudoglutamicibacter albus]|uniref:Uncharacterized protein n=1 Tax=Pseudoglutamicibacter albus TaxID=98671 RepID=A0ABU1YZW3_9MICC|nr:hypothetical protein [Pseudoglutamicibacter albus]MDR7293905.1 hypothetical protein [Pseudoglutamicibacter albus]